MQVSQDYEAKSSDTFTAYYDHCCFWNPVTSGSTSQIFEPSNMDGATYDSAMIQNPLLIDTCWHNPNDKFVDLHVASNSPVKDNGLAEWELILDYHILDELVDIDNFSGASGSSYDIGCDELP